MAEEDSQLTRIAPDFTWLVDDVSWPRPNVGLSPERWDSYRALFKETGASHGVFRRQGAPGVFLIASAEGIAGRGSSKGYVFARVPLEPILASLDGSVAGVKREALAYKRIEPDWYLY